MIGTMTGLPASHGRGHVDATSLQARRPGLEHQARRRQPVSPDGSQLVRIRFDLPANIVRVEAMRDGPRRHLFENRTLNLPSPICGPSSQGIRPSPASCRRPPVGRTQTYAAAHAPLGRPAPLARSPRRAAAAVGHRSRRHVLAARREARPATSVWIMHQRDIFALSRRKHGVESPESRQLNQILSGTFDPAVGGFSNFSPIGSFR